MKAETTLMQKIQLKASELGWRLFRNNVGLGWTGRPVPVKGTNHVLLQNAKRIRFGLAIGSSDLVGIRPVKITADMVGTTIGQFVAREIKTPKGHATSEQIDFVLMVNRLGGDGLIISSVNAIE